MRKEERKEIQICRDEAKRRTKENEKSYMQNLHAIAKELGFKSWDSLLKTNKK